MRYQVELGFQAGRTTYRRGDCVADPQWPNLSAMVEAGFLLPIAEELESPQSVEGSDDHGSSDETARRDTRVRRRRGKGEPQPGR